MAEPGTKKGFRKCKRCDGYIEFIRTDADRFMPVDSGLKTFITKEGKTEMGYTPHWASCADSDFFRKKNEERIEGNNG